jgi:hypothetical protein
MNNSLNFSITSMVIDPNGVQPSYVLQGLANGPCVLFKRLERKKTCQGKP